MHSKCYSLLFASLLLVLTWAGTAQAQVPYLLKPNSGGQIQIGGGLPLPIQLTDANMDMTVDWGAQGITPIVSMVIPGTFMGPGAGVFPPLLIHRKDHPFGKAPLISTTGGPGKALVIPPFVLSRPAAQRTLGQFSQNPGLHAVATNLTYKWPAAKATLGPRVTTTTAIGAGMVALPKNMTTVFTFGTIFAGANKVRYLNTSAAPLFGGPANFVITPKTGTPGPTQGMTPAGFPVTMGPIKSSVGVSVWALAGTPPPCTMPCGAALLKAAPLGPQAPGGAPLTVVLTAGGNVAPPDIYAIVNGATPAGTIALYAAPVGPTMTNLAPTNMASSNGFPWTTGRVTVSAPTAAGTPENFVLAGGDFRTPGGNGVIQLVSGSLSQRVTTGPNGNRGWIRLDLEAPGKVPSLSTGGLAALSFSLLAVSGFVYARRRMARA